MKTTRYEKPTGEIYIGFDSNGYWHHSGRVFYRGDGLTNGQRERLALWSGLGKPLES